MNINENIKLNYHYILLLIIIQSLIVLIISEIGLTNERYQNINLEIKNQYPTMKNTAEAKWEILGKRKIYFGHHSVGSNIIQGIEDLMNKNPHIKMNMVRTSDVSNFKMGIFAHSEVGKNGQPESKIADFLKFIENGIGKGADFAGFKFCFADILFDTDIKMLFEQYRDSIAIIKNNYPELKIIHFTCPLTKQSTTWKHLVKKILHVADPWRYGSNIKRNEYNKKLIEEYQDKDFIFDIAQIESTRPDGTRFTFDINGNTYYSLVPEYTSDGGHLNEIGRKKVAEQFLLFLANLD